MSFLRSFFTLPFILYMVAIIVGYNIIDVDTTREWLGATFILLTGVVYGGLDD